MQSKDYGMWIPGPSWWALCISTVLLTGPAARADLVDLQHALERATFSAELEIALRSGDGLPFQRVGPWAHDADAAVSLGTVAPIRDRPRLVDLSQHARNGVLSVSLRLEGDPAAFSSAGLLFGMSDPNHGFALLVVEGRGVQLVELIEGRLEPRANAAMNIEEERTYRIEVEVRDDEIGARVDGQTVLEHAIEGGIHLTGIGVIRAAGSGARFEQMTLEPAGEAMRSIEFEFRASVPLLDALERSGAIEAVSAHKSPLVRRVDLNGDQRIALVVPPGTEIQIPIGTLEKGALRYELGAISDGETGAGASVVRLGIRTDTGAEFWAPPRLRAAHGRGGWIPEHLAFANGGERPLMLIVRNDAVGSGPGAYAAIANPTLEPDSRESADRRPNVILLVIDTLRASSLGFFGSKRSDTLFLDSLATSSIAFVSTSAQSSWTKTSMASMFTSTLPETNGVRAVTDRLAAEALTLAEQMRAHGYFTVGVQTNPWVNARFGMTQGFSEYHVLDAGARASRVNETALSILTRRGKTPYLLYLHYMDVHNPYLPPPSYLPETRDPIDLYRAALRYLDAQIASLYGLLEEAGQLENTIFAVVSDHGEEFGEHGGIHHGRTLYREQLHVPLILSWPRAFPVARRIENPVQNLDIAPTLLDLASIPVPQVFQGRSLRSELSGSGLAERASVAQVGMNDMALENDFVSIQIGRWKYIKDRRSDWRRLFDLAEDPSELRNRAGDRPEVLRRLNERIDALLLRVAESRRAPVILELDPALVEQLQSLGYLDP